MRLFLMRFLLITIAFLLLFIAIGITWPIALITAYVIEQIFEPALTTKL